MKILCLNIWGGRLSEELIQLCLSTDIDVFCLQEVYHQAHQKDTIWKGANFNIFEDLSHALPSYQSFYHPHLQDWWGLATFVKESITVEDAGETFVHLYKGHDLKREKLGHTAKNLQYFKTTLNGKPLTVINFHGLWNGNGKTDCAERIAQSEKVAQFIQSQAGEVILCGDFNLLPNTRSMQIIERTGLRNLIKEYGVTSTRTSFYPKPEKFADYILVSHGITVKEFKVLPEEVSDHSPLYLEIA